MRMTRTLSASLLALALAACAESEDTAYEVDATDEGGGELIVAELVWGSLGCWVFFAVWGGYALDLQISGRLDVGAVLSAEGIPATVQAILGTLPFSGLVTAAFVALCFIFLATTLDSAACDQNFPRTLWPTQNDDAAAHVSSAIAHHQ